MSQNTSLRRLLLPGLLAAGITCAAAAAAPAPAPVPRPDAAIAAAAGTATGQAAENVALSTPATPTAPAWSDKRSFESLGYPSDTLLLGVRNGQAIEFQVRRDRLVKEATLDLDYTPSPSLLPGLSHLRVYLNDELMGVLPIDASQLGQRVRRQIALDPRLMADFNRVRLEFVGHYTDICEDLAHSSLWLNVGRDSALNLAGEVLAMQDDLANFPLPFFDSRDTARLELPFVFAEGPGVDQQQAAAVLASYFGSRAGWWRQSRFPVSFGALPERGHAVVFAVNGRLPDFLRDHAPVDGPVVELANVPGDPTRKLLLVLGRDAADLQRAATALAAGNMVFRGRQVRIDKVQELKPRKPYDAPNWTRTDRPVRFEELLEYPQQLQASGLLPRPITVNLNLPPDLFVWRNQGIPLHLDYRYTPPYDNDESRLRVSVNDQFIASFPLVRDKDRNGVERMRLPVLTPDAGASGGKLLIPALKIGERNQLRFDFSYTSVIGSAQRDRCQTMLPPDVQAAIEEDSTIDFSGFHHFIGLPDLKAFAGSGFPFSRMADLSETMVLVPGRTSPEQVGTMLDAVGGLGAQTGYPGFGVRVTADVGQAVAADADLLVLGPLPEEVRGNAEPALLLENQRSRLLRGRIDDPNLAAVDARQGIEDDDSPTLSVEVTAQAPLAAIVGFQSPRHPQRSVVVLSATQAADYALLRDVLTDTGKRGAVSGSVAVIRSSGVSSQFVGEHYYVGSLPWWLLLWYHLADHPILLALLSALVVIMAGFLLWRGLRWVARRRLAAER